MSERSIQDIVEDIKVNTSSLISDTRTLAKEEIKSEVTKAGVGVGLFACAGMCVFTAIIIFSIAVGLALFAAGLPIAWAFAIDGVIFVILAILSVMVGVRLFKKISPPVRTQAAMAHTLQAFSASISPTTSTSTDTEDHGYHR